MFFVAKNMLTAATNGFFDAVNADYERLIDDSYARIVVTRRRLGERGCRHR